MSACLKTSRLAFTNMRRHLVIDLRSGLRSSSKVDLVVRVADAFSEHKNCENCGCLITVVFLVLAEYGESIFASISEFSRKVLVPGSSF